MANKLKKTLILRNFLKIDNRVTERSSYHAIYTLSLSSIYIIYTCILKQLTTDLEQYYNVMSYLNIQFL